MIVIVDYQMGNVASVRNAFEQLGQQVMISNRAEDIRRAGHIVLPGVGAFGEGMKRLKALGLTEILYQEVIENKKPFLGICLGMQLLAKTSDEFGAHEGLGWIPGEVHRIQANGMRLPHVGWNNLRLERACPLLNEWIHEADFYFVHSYHFKAEVPDHVSAVCDYGETFSAVINKDNIFGVQFHPEKSQKAGRILLENFVRL